MYATNAGTHVLPLTMQKRPVANQEGQNGLFASAAFDQTAGEIIIKVANTSRTEQQLQFNLSGLKGEHQATTLTLSHNGMDDENSIKQPTLIAPKEGKAEVVAGKKGATLNDQLPPMSFRIYRIK